MAKKVRIPGIVVAEMELASAAMRYASAVREGRIGDAAMYRMKLAEAAMVFGDWACVIDGMRR